MSKSVYIAEKPSVAQEFAKALHEDFERHEGFLESAGSIVTWCVGHLITMSYPEIYDARLKRWSLNTLPFLPKEFKYEVIPAVSRQFETVKSILTRQDVGTIYVCTDSGREGEYIYRLVEQMAGVAGKQRRRVWIDSQTEEEIHRGIREAKDLSEYDNLSESAYLRAKEDYLMGINFSRLLTLKYGSSLASYLKKDRVVVSVGRVMTCVLGMVVRREREIREFVKTPFYRVLGTFETEEKNFDAEWRAVEGSRYFDTPFLYKENGFRERKKAQELIDYLNEPPQEKAVVEQIENKKENKNPPLLYNLAELQNDCSKMFKISPDETLKIVQELYERKLVTYPRTDARVLSTAVCKEIEKNLDGLRGYGHSRAFAEEILQNKAYKNIANTRYCNDKQITDHYAIIPTGQGISSLNSLPQRSKNVYETIVRRFLGIFYPAAVYRRFSLVINLKNERFFASFKALEQEGYLKVSGANAYSWKNEESNDTEDAGCDSQLLEELKKLKKGAIINAVRFAIKEGETTPPKRYTSGSMILAMENAGQLIEDEELRSLIKGSGIGTSATRAEILKKLNTIAYIQTNSKTQVITPTLLGEMIFDVVNMSIRQLLNPDLTASWEKGLSYVSQGTITSKEYMDKLEHFIISRTNGVLKLSNQSYLKQCFDQTSQNYK